MSIRLVDTDWERELVDGLAGSEGAWRLACPFIKVAVVERLLDVTNLGTIEVVTRFSLGDFAAGVSDIGALRALVCAGAEVRGLRQLHSKVFVFGHRRAAVTSANLTNAALARNAEFGCVSDDAEFVAACRDYVATLWGRASAAVTLDQLDEWDAIVIERLARGGKPSELAGLPDFGASAHVPPSPLLSPILPPAGSNAAGWPVESTQAFVKFFGQSDDRASGAEAIVDEILSAGCHWACTYPGKSGRPRLPQDGDTMFMGRMTHSPNDTLIFGRAIAMHHVDERDTATAADIAERPWKVDWPHYIRVHHADFIAGVVRNGIRLSELMDELGASAFASTQEHLRAGDGGNTDPRKALMRKPAVRLSNEGFAWLTSRFEQRLLADGRVPATELEQFDWPSIHRD